MLQRCRLHTDVETLQLGILVELLSTQFELNLNSIRNDPLIIMYILISLAIFPYVLYIEVSQTVNSAKVPSGLKQVSNTAFSNHSFKGKAKTIFIKAFSKGSLKY